MTRIKNTLDMLQYLSQRKEVSLDTLSQKYNVTKRTIQRMRDDLVEIGYDIETKYGPFGGLKLHTSPDFPIATFTKEELNDISLGLQDLMNKSHSVFRPEFASSIAKLSLHMSQKSGIQTFESASTRQLNVNLVEYQNHIDIIRDAIQTKTKIKIEYKRLAQKGKEETLSPLTYIFEPYDLYLVEQVWYVFGLNENNDRRNLRISRIINVEALDKKYRPDPEYLGQSNVGYYGFKIDRTFVKLRVRNADYLTEYIWGEDQKIEWIDPFTFDLSVEFATRYAAINFILSAGSKIEVLEPEDIKTYIKTEVNKMLELYK
ncbi:MAG: WYL domain-containing protein [Erysipelothrix sp.]|nr:WYL domain-containing protein [Erysipelothrix sp.]